jgi:beta-lactamase regulating signal transducer with metallopeptidase domain
VKVLWDFGKGVPAQSFLWLELVGAKQELGSFAIGLSLKRVLRMHVNALLQAHSHGLAYPQSAADLLFRGLSHRLSPAAPAALVFALCGVAWLKLGARAVALRRFARDARAIRERAHSHGAVRVGFRTAEIYVSEHYDGAPFAAGLLRPYVVLPARAFEALSGAARQAAIQHELAHLTYLDPLLIGCVSGFSDLFWYLPGLRWLRRRLFAEIELAADARAVRDGAAPEALADALVTVGEHLHASRGALASLLGEQSTLRQRVRRLLDPRSEGRSARWPRWVARALILAVFVPGVLSSIFFGNP